MLSVSTQIYVLKHSSFFFWCSACNLKCALSLGPSPTLAKLLVNHHVLLSARHPCFNAKTLDWHLVSQAVTAIAGWFSQHINESIQPLGHCDNLTTNCRVTVHDELQYSERLEFLRKFDANVVKS